MEKLTEIASEYGLSVLELAMKWCLSREKVPSVISGVSKLAQIEQNIASLEGAELHDDVLQACDAVWHSLAGTRFGYNR